MSDFFIGNNIQSIVYKYERDQKYSSRLSGYNIQGQSILLSENAFYNTRHNNDLYTFYIR